MTKKFFGSMLVGVGVVAGAFLLQLGEAEAAINQLKAPSFEQEGAAWDGDGQEYAVPTLSYNWHGFGSGYVRTNTSARFGSFAAHVANQDSNAFAGAYQRLDLYQQTVQPVYFGAYVKGSNIALRDGSYFGATLYAEIHLQNGQVVYWNTPARSGTFDWTWIGFNTAQLGDLISAPISHVFVVPSVIYATGTAYFDDVVVKTVDTGEATEAMMADQNPPAPTPAPVLNGWHYIRPYGWVNVSNGFFYYNGRWIRA